LAAAARFPLDEICSFPNEWPQSTMRLYFRFIVPRMGQWDFRPRLGELALPLLVIQGTDDLVPTEASRQWVVHAGNARFLPIEGAGHHPYIERPEEFFAAARSFLAGAWPEAAETLAAA
jgi:pimeloyl-ACP methyl ester carboxylesterase